MIVNSNILNLFLFMGVFGKVGFWVKLWLVGEFIVVCIGWFGMFLVLCNVMMLVGF